MGALDFWTSLGLSDTEPASTATPLWSSMEGFGEEEEEEEGELGMKQQNMAESRPIFEINDKRLCILYMSGGYKREGYIFGNLWLACSFLPSSLFIFIHFTCLLL